ncbi:hypothetical protein O6H91_15G026900 [Diphasiastrum complanatum]|uniref:Uncharacterized protein n=1 Tax=Diphasiastrum complanatum TaxID=34168 RepID=A0ACC2BHL5_DIPCM|nr:hypothetical protein O6H91_15G026900 [Diphasiastrum complanatum]
MACRRAAPRSQYNPRSVKSNRGFWKGCLAALCCCCLLDECCCDPTVVVVES